MRIRMRRGQGRTTECGRWWSMWSVWRIGSCGIECGGLIVGRGESRDWWWWVVASKTCVHTWVYTRVYTMTCGQTVAHEAELVCPLLEGCLEHVVREQSARIGGGSHGMSAA